MDKGTQDLDEIWRVLNPWGRFQVFQLFLTVLDFVPACFAILSAVLTGYIPEYECMTPSETTNHTSQYGNLSYVPRQCEVDIYTTEYNSTMLVESKTCDEYTFSNERSYAYEWKLVCSKSNVAALAQSLALAGQGIGAFIMSHLADRYGRRTVHVLCHIGILVSMALIAVSPNIYVLLVFRLVTGTFQQGVVCTSKTLSLELLPKEIRAHTSPVGFIFWAFGVMLLSLYGYVFQDINWRYLQLAIAAFSVYALVEWWLMDESIRWLLSNGRVNDVKRILKKAARWNNVDYDIVENVLERNLVLVEESEVLVLQDSEKLAHTKSENDTGKPSSSTLVVQDSEKVTGTNGETDTGEPTKTAVSPVVTYTVIDILKNPALRTNTFILWYCWIVVTGTYYGLTLVSSHLAGDRFLNFFLSGVIEIPSHVASLYLLNKIGRKKTLMLWISLACISLIVSTVTLTAFADSNITSIIATISSMTGKSSITGAFSTVFLYTPELYPTNYRNSGLGIASSISRIGGILAPFASNLALIALWIPGAIFASMCLLAVILIIKLPESARHELPTTIAELDAWQNEEKL